MRNHTCQSALWLARRLTLPLPWPATPRRGVPGRGGNSGGSDKYAWQEFGHPSRRLTDTLLVLNVALYGAQLLTQEGLTLWGVKVGLGRSRRVARWWAVGG